MRKPQSKLGFGRRRGLVQTILELMATPAAYLSAECGDATRNAKSCIIASLHHLPSFPPGVLYFGVRHDRVGFRTHKRVALYRPRTTPG